MGQKERLNHTQNGVNSSVNAGRSRCLGSIPQTSLLLQHIPYGSAVFFVFVEGIDSRMQS